MCDQCGNNTLQTPKVCTGCYDAHYCGTHCQRAAWKAGHREVCEVSTCPICHDDLHKGTMKLPCGHRYHQECLTDHTRHAGPGATCPCCRGPLLTWISYDSLPEGMPAVRLLRMLLGNVDTREGYDLVLLTSSKAAAWLRTLRPYAALQEATGIPAYVDYAIKTVTRCGTAKDFFVCYPLDGKIGRQLPADPQRCRYMACPLELADKKKIDTMYQARQEGDMLTTVLSPHDHRYWLVAESPEGNRLAQWAALAGKGGMDTLRPGSPVAGYPANRSCHWAGREVAPYEGHVVWDQGKPTVTQVEALTQQLQRFRPFLSAVVHE